MLLSQQLSGLPMLACLTMYRFPELVAGHDRFWALIRSQLSARGIASPSRLSQDHDPLTAWEDPSLVLGQTCGMPYRSWLHDKVELVGTPDYALDGCPPGYYRSALVVRADDSRTRLEDFQHAVFAFNNAHSQSGFAAPYWHAHASGFWFERRLESGAHLESARAVVTGRADIAALDAVSYALMQRHTDFAASLATLEWTTPTPGLPYIAARGANTTATFDAVATAINELSAQDRHSLKLNGIVHIPRQDYLAVRNP